MNATFCDSVGTCSASTCNPDEVICIEDFVVKLQFGDVGGPILYLFFRILERLIFALHGQTTRELLQVEKSERFNPEVTMCCKREKYDCTKSGCGPCRKTVHCTCPTGVWKQVWLRFFGTTFGVISFFLILNQNIFMFFSVIAVDVLAEYSRFRCQTRDHANYGHGDFDISLLLQKDWSVEGLDEKWMSNMRQFLKQVQASQERQTPSGVPSLAAPKQMLKFF